MRILLNSGAIVETPNEELAKAYLNRGTVIVDEVPNAKEKPKTKNTK